MHLFRRQHQQRGFTLFGLRRGQPSLNLRQPLLPLSDLPLQNDRPPSMRPPDVG
jgi:hypothetical protein